MDRVESRYAFLPVQTNPWLVAFGIVWAVAVGAGFKLLLSYEHTPGVAARPPERWPVESSIERLPGRPTLIMLAHPHCPCTRASMGELAALMARTRGLMSATVLFVVPSEVGDDWRRTDLWESAAALPEVRVMEDRDGREAGLFHAATSGQTLLYDAAGNLKFSGGITDARGHFGDNAGEAAILALLTTGSGDHATTPVFGCSLLGNTAEGAAANLNDQRVRACSQ